MGWGSGERLAGWMDGWVQVMGMVREAAGQTGRKDQGILNSLAGWHLCLQMHISQMWKLPRGWNVAICWTRGHANGRGAAMCGSGAFDWKSAVKSSTSMWGWSWVNVLHVNATLPGRLNQNSRCYPFFFFFLSERLPGSPSLADLSPCHSFSLTTKARSFLSPSVNYRQYRLFLGIFRDPFSVLNHIRWENFF